MIYPSSYVRVRVAGRNGASSIESIPVYRVVTPGFISGMHACRALGNDGSTQGVMCADLFAERDNTGGVQVSATVEGACESLANRNIFPECAEIDMFFSAHRAQSDFGDPLTLEQCARHFNDPCSTPREFFEAAPLHDIPGPCNTSVGGPNEVWTVVGLGSSIELPVSGAVRFLAANLGSNHGIICGAL
jgi:hypothetical protein